MQRTNLLRPATWSYRVKVPLLITGVSVVTALAISLAIALSAGHWLREDLHDHAITVAESLARGLVVQIARDDVWEGFEAVRAVAAVDGGSRRCDVVVLDRSDHVFVSSQPLRFGVGSPIAALTGPLRHAAQLIAKPGAVTVEELHTNEGSYSIVSMPLLSGDRELLGTLLMSYSHAIFAQRYHETILTLAAITAGLVTLLVPLGWWLGHRLADPMARINETLLRLADDAAASSSAYRSTPGTALPFSRHGASELDRLEDSLLRLQQKLNEKDLLQQQFIAADRLAAIGRMTSMVAHEINNPLAGMLNALSNLRKDPSLLQKTLALLERGFEQIRQTLSALLIETKTTNRPLSPSDIEDLRILVAPQAMHKQVRLEWNYPFTTALGVPAAPVRQVVLNLLLNAVHASEMQIALSASATDSELTIKVANDGDEFPVALRQMPFEPIVEGEGHGLGLWASHQLVTSLGGHITWSFEGGTTQFEVRLPLNPVPWLGAARVESVEATACP